jgi:hypothetical protein
MSENFVTRSLYKHVCEEKGRFHPIMLDKGESTITNRRYGGEFLTNGGTSQYQSNNMTDKNACV